MAPIPQGTTIRGEVDAEVLALPERFRARAPQCRLPRPPRSPPQLFRARAPQRRSPRKPCALLARFHARAPQRRSPRPPRSPPEQFRAQRGSAEAVRAAGAVPGPRAAAPVAAAAVPPDRAVPGTRPAGPVAAEAVRFAGAALGLGARAAAGFRAADATVRAAKRCDGDQALARRRRRKGRPWRGGAQIKARSSKLKRELFARHAARCDRVYAGEHSTTGGIRRQAVALERHRRSVGRGFRFRCRRSTRTLSWFYCARSEWW